MALTPGTRVGPYEVSSLIGAGGMGEVYKAADTNLKRAVALKVLPLLVAADAERLARFQREAEVLAALNHPNIAAIYGLERSGDTTALVMEFVDGEDLSQRIARGSIPTDEALLIAKQIAEALEAAHEQGIIHRDLKPANIKVRADGTVKVLDFGLAKAIEGSGGAGRPGGEDLTNSPTLATPAMTMRGMILGTAGYMAPEQAKGKSLDRRADMWAFGVVVYEMLTGRRAFKGEDPSETIAAIISGEPDWSALPAGTPAPIRRLLRRCLERDRKRRLDSAAAARLEIDEALTAPAVTAQSSTPSSAASSRVPWIGLALAAVVIVALAIPAARHLRETPPPLPPETRLDIVTPATDDPTSFALSPDGRHVAFVGSGDDASQLWLRSLATTMAQPLAGTDGGSFPFWSPDSRSIGFFVGSALKRLDLGGGAPQTLAPASTGRGGTWNADGVIVFAPSAAAPLMRVSATGGTATAATTLGPQQFGHTAPSFLPDGRRFLFTVGARPDTAGIYLGALDGSAPIRLTYAETGGTYLAARPGSAEALRGGGWLLWVRAGILLAQQLDVEKAVLTGEPVTLADGVAVDDTVFYRSAVSVAATGLVAYRAGGASQRQLTWVDRSGTARGTIGDPDATLMCPRVSPDGRRVAVGRMVHSNIDVWLLDGARTSRFTFDSARDDLPVWSPDSTQIVFRSSRTGTGDLYQKLTSGAGVEERLVASDELKIPTSWSADGRFLLYISLYSQTNYDLGVVPMVGPSSGSGRMPSAFLKGPFRETRGEFSPDGRWVAYHSNESGRNEIYVRPFFPSGAAGAAAGADGGQWQVSTAGGIMAVWRPDGKELYYLDPTGAMMAAPISGTGATFAPGTPVALFPTRILGGGVDAEQGRQYDVAHDGRFLINTELDSAAAPITLLMNWHPDAKK